MTPKKIYLLAHDLAFLSSKHAKPILYNCDISIVDVLGGQVPYILESEHNRIVDELKSKLDECIIGCDVLSDNQTPEILKDFVNEAMYVIGLKNDKRFTNAELSKDKLFEMFEDILYKI
jgi:hypothetical protein